MLKDARLVRKARRGCRDSMRSIYEMYKDDLLTLANALLNDTGGAEDVVHDVFVSFVQSLDEFKVKKSLRGYFVTCVRNLARDRIRTRTRRLDRLDEHGRSELLKAESDSPCKLALEKESCQLVRDAIEQLPYDQREVVVLRVKADLTFKEIASLQSVSINTVQGRYRYGLNKLRSILDVHCGLETDTTTESEVVK